VTLDDMIFISNSLIMLWVTAEDLNKTDVTSTNVLLFLSRHTA